jgi:hypothetical protein
LKNFNNFSRLDAGKNIGFVVKKIGYFDDNCLFFDGRLLEKGRQIRNFLFLTAFLKNLSKLT